MLMTIIQEGRETDGEKRRGVNTRQDEMEARGTVALDESKDLSSIAKEGK